MGDFNSDNDLQLLSQAQEAHSHAHVPYTRRPRGAAVRASDGTVSVGCTFELASFVGTLCAEQIAISGAIARGVTPKDLTEIAVFPESLPCGVCRQSMLEVNPDMIFIVQRGDTVTRLTLEQLLPHSFGGECLR